MRTMFGTGRGLHNVILIGTGPLAVRIARELTKPKSGYRLLYYVENWSLSMDVSILARTLVSVAARKGAI